MSQLKNSDDSSIITSWADWRVKMYDYLLVVTQNNNWLTFHMVLLFAKNNSSVMLDTLQSKKVSHEVNAFLQRVMKMFLS